MNIKFKFFVVLVMVLIMISSLSYADEKEDLLVIRNTVVNLLQQLVDRGVMSPEEAKQLVETAKQSAETEAAEIRKSEEISKDTVRVQYVPEIVKQEIREQVRSELRAEVTQDIIKHAQTNRWGINDALPSWISRIKISGDVRVRAEGEYLDEDNSQLYVDAGDNDGAPTMLDIRNDRERARVRMRLAVKAKVNNSIEAGIRIASGNLQDPVSTNQTLGNTGSRYDVTLDRAYLKYTNTNNDGYDWLTVWGGRIPNPWFSTDLIWDSDLSFEGFAATARHNFAGGDSLYDITETNKEIFLTMGAFPIEEFAESSNDPWLFGAQLGGGITFNNQNQIKLGVAYYYYDDLQVDPAPLNTGSLFDFRAPQNIGQGNSLIEIQDPSSTSLLLGYASDFELLGFTAQGELSTFAPYRLKLTGEYFENIGYDRNDVNELLGFDLKEETTAYQMRIDFGWPRLNQLGNWRIYGAYKYIERDALLAAFTDSDFHGGGTDAEGYVLGADYGLGQNAWLSLKWISSDEIDGPEYRNIDCDGVDVLGNPINCDYKYDRLQFDVNAKF